MKGEIKVEYNQPNEDLAGRYQAKNKLSGQGMMREIRYTIYNEHYLDLDIVNAHCVFLAWLCDNLNIKCLALKEYIINREKHIQDIMKINHNFTRDTGKTLFLSINNGGNVAYDSVKNKTDFLLKYKSEIQTITNSLIKHFDTFYDIVEEIKEERNEDYNIKGATVSHILQFVENQVLMIIFNYLKSKLEDSIYNSILCYDGIMIPKEHWNEEYIGELEELISKDGMDIKLKVKEMVPIDLSQYRYNANKVYDVYDCVTYKSKESLIKNVLSGINKGRCKNTYKRAVVAKIIINELGKHFKSFAIWNEWCQDNSSYNEILISNEWKNFNHNSNEYDMNYFLNMLNIDSSQKYNSLCKSLVAQDTIEIKKNVVPKNMNYFGDDNFHFSNLLSHIEYTIFKSYRELVLYLHYNMPRVCARLHGVYILKIYDDDKYFTTEKSSAVNWNEVNINYKIHNNIHTTDLYTVYTNNSCLFSRFKNISVDFTYNYDDLESFCMNRPFIAKQLEKYNLNTIQFLLDFILDVYCRNDINKYNYFMSWLSFSVKFPHLKSKKAVVLFSIEQQIGKGSITSFLCDFVYGSYNTIPNLKGIGELLNENNYQMLGKKFVCVNELAGIKESFKAGFDVMKTLITDTDINVKKLYLDRFSSKQVCEFIFLTNNKYSFNIEERDNRYFMLHVSGKYYGNNEFMTSFNEKLRTVEVGNNFYSYLMSNTFITTYQDFYNMKIPMTQYKRDIIHISGNHIKDFIEFLLNENHQYNTNEDQYNVDNQYITYTEYGQFTYQASIFYECYKNWYKINNPSMFGCLPNTKFKTLLIDEGFESKKSEKFLYFKFDY